MHVCFKVFVMIVSTRSDIAASVSQSKTFSVATFAVFESQLEKFVFILHVFGYFAAFQIRFCTAS